jgi:hypothetical protein
MAINRKEFIKYACLSGACMCGFSALPSSSQVTVNNVPNLTPADDKNLLLQDMISGLLSNLSDGLDKETLRKIIKKNAIIHYTNLKMDEVLKPFENNLSSFNTFLQEKWGWKIDYNASAKTLIANENKNFCVCPMVNREKGASGALCYCSESFSELMFSKVIGKPVTSNVISSVLRGDKNCQYKIEWK